MSRASALLVLAVAGCTLCGPYTDTPTDTDEALAVTFHCEEHWCGEEWRADRVLQYNLSVQTIRTDDQSQHHGPVLNCQGGQVSTDCVLEGNVSAGAPSVREVINRTLLSTEVLGPEGFLATNNFAYESLNDSISQLEDTYRGNQDKIWQIKIPHGCQMWMSFQEFEIEPTVNCRKDYFSVQISKNQRDIRKYCMSLESIAIQRRKRVQLWFHSDGSVQRKGIFAWFCFREILSRDSTQEAGENQTFCNCNQGNTRSGKRRRRSRNRGIQDQLSAGIQDSHRREEERVVRQWLKDLSVRGETALREYLADLSNHKRHLFAQSYQRALQRQFSVL